MVPLRNERIDHETGERFDAADQTDVGCDRKVQRIDYTNDPVDGEWIYGTCDETPTVKLEGQSRGFSGKVTHRCRRHTMEARGLWRIPREAVKA